MTSFPCASMSTSHSYHARSAISSAPVRSLIANSLESKLYHDRVSCQSKLSFQELGARKSELHGSSFAVALPFLSKNYGCRVVGRNARMTITAALPANRGGGHKRLYRKIDFRRNDKDKAGRITTIEYDPNRNANISLIQYGDGEKKYILHPRGAIIGDTVVSGTDVPIKMGNCLPLTEMPLGTAVHNVEITPGRGGQLVRSAGAVAKLIAKEGKNVTLKMPSGEVRLINRNCLATVGQVGNVGVNQKPLGKAGAKRWLGKRPSVRGIAKNPCDHPHGGGEGRAPIGRKGPVTPWGYAALGRRTRKARKYSDNMIVRRRTKA